MANRKHLIWQLYPSYLLLALLALAATGWYASRSMRQFYLDQTRQNLNIQARLIAGQLPIMVTDPLNGPAVDRFCKHAAATLPIRITVILPDGVVLGDSQAVPATMENHGDRPEIKQALANQNRHRDALQRNPASANDVCGDPFGE